MQPLGRFPRTVPSWWLHMRFAALKSAFVTRVEINTSTAGPAVKGAHEHIASVCFVACHEASEHDAGGSRVRAWWRRTGAELLFDAARGTNWLLGSSIDRGDARAASPSRAQTGCRHPEITEEDAPTPGRRTPEAFNFLP